MANQVVIEVVTEIKDAGAINRAGAGMVADARRTASDIDAAFTSIKDPEVNVKYQDSEVRRAEGDIRDLDSIPPPTIKPQGDATAAVSDIKSDLGALDGIGDAVGNDLGMGMVSGLKSFGPAVGIAGALLGDDMAAGFTRGWSSGLRDIEVQLRTGMGPIQASQIGSAAGAAYGGGFGEQFESTLDAAIILERKLGDIDPSLNLQKATEWAVLLEEHLGVGVVESAELAGRMIQQGLARNTEDAYDIMIDAAQRYGAQSNDVLEATREFGGVFQKLGIDGAASVRFIGDAYEQGLTSQVERSAEALEELNTRITDGDSREAVERLGLSFEEMQNKLANGRGTEVLAEIANGLLNNVDAAERATRANEIFGTSFETTGEIDAFLESMIELSGAQTDVGGTAEDASQKVKDMQTALDEAQRQAGEGAAKLGEWSAAAVLLADQLQDPVDVGNAAVDVFKRYAFGANDARRSTNEWADSAVDAADAANGFEQRAQAAADASREVAEATAEAASEFDTAKDAINGALSALEGWASNTGEDAIIALGDAAADLTDKFDENTAASFSVAEGFDLSTDAGRRGAEAAQAYRGDMAELTDALLGGRVSADEYASATSNAEAQMREAAAAAGFTDSQIEALIAEYGRVPDNVQTQVDAIGNAWDQVGSLLNSISRIPRSVTTTHTVNTRRTTTLVGGPRAAGGPVGWELAGGGMPAAASGGGGAMGIDTLVNERGPESVRLPAGDVVPLPAGASVLTAEDTAHNSMVAQDSTLVINNYISGSLVATRDLNRATRDSLYQGGFDGLGGIN